MWMLRQGITETFETWKDFFLLALRFDGFDQVESYYYDFMLFRTIIDEALRRKEMGQYSEYQVKEPALSIIAAVGVSDFSALQCWSYGDLYQKLARYIKSADPQQREGNHIENLSLKNCRLSEPEKIEPNWPCEPEGPGHILVLVLRAMADLRAIQQVPKSFGHIFPAEIVLQVQQQVSTNPIVLRDQGLQATITSGRDLKPYLKLLENVAGEALDAMESQGGFYLEGMTPYSFDLPPWIPLSLPFIRPLSCLRTMHYALLSAEVSKIPGANEVFHNHCLQANPITVSKMIKEKICNPRELFLTATGERRDPDHKPDDDTEPMERPVREFKAAQVLFPCRKRRSSETSFVPAVKSKPRPKSNGQCESPHTAATFATIRHPNYVQSTLDVPWNSFKWMRQQYKRYKRNRSMSFDSEEAAARTTRLARYGCEELDLMEFIPRTESAQSRTTISLVNAERRFNDNPLPLDEFNDDPLLFDELLWYYSGRQPYS